MQKKQCEADFANLMGRMSKKFGIWSHKWADMRYCPRCHNLLYKVDDNVDYTIIVGDKPGLVECKQDEERFSFANEELGIRPRQREWLNEWQRLNRHSWLFLELGTGSAPKDRNAWLVWWPHWLVIESRLEERGMKSIPWRETRQSKEFNAVEMLSEHQLLWEPKVGFVIPTYHSFYTIFNLKQIKD